MKVVDYMKKLIKLFEIFLFIIFLVLLLFTKQKLIILLTIPILLFIYFFTKLPIKRYGLFIFITALIIRLLTIFILKVEVLDDFKTMLDASRLLIKGNLSFTNSFYFKNFSYQLGHVIYQAILLKIYNKVIILKIVNSIITSLIVLFIYLITKKLFKEKTARMVSLGYIFYLYPLYLNSVLTNQHIPALLYLIVIYLLLEKKSTFKTYTIIGILLVFANFLRTESIIFIMGIIMFDIITITKNNYKTIIKNISAMTIIFILGNILLSTLVFISPLKLQLKNNAPSWKFYCGLSNKYNGTYNKEDEEKYFNQKDKDKLLKSRIKNEYKKFPVLFIKKEVILWTQTNYDITINNNINSKLYKLILDFNQGYLNLVILLFVISIYPLKKVKDNKSLLIKIVISLYILIYALIEISPRYAYILHILMFLLIGKSIEIIKGVNNENKL